MKRFSGINELIENKESLPKCNFLYIPADADVETEAGLLRCEFLFSENESEELALENDGNFLSWLEAPIFSGIVKTVEEYIDSPTTEDIIRATLYYWEHDAFLEYE